MKEYFDAEMRSLTEAAQEFAKRYPEQAGMLNLKNLQDRDPYIERLLEGFAFLTAQIRQKIDDSIPELSENLLQQLWPQMLVPLPAMVIMQFYSSNEQLKNTEIIPKGTLISTEPVGDKNPQPCVFRTASEVVINPLQITNVTVTEADSGGCLLQLDFKSDGKLLNKMDLKNFRIYLTGNLSITAHLHFMLTSQVQAVNLIIADKFGAQNTHNLGAEAIVPCMLGPEEILNPNNNKSFFGFHLIQEYFAFREKYLFVNIQNLDHINWSDDCYNFSLLIQSKINVPNNSLITQDNFCLYCVPAINLFIKSSEPVAFDNRRLKYRLIADADYPDSNIIYDVKQIAFKFNRDETKNNISYNVSRQNNEVYLVLNNESNSAVKSLSCEITVCNGNYPYRYISERQINQNFNAYPGVKVRNLTRPTSMYNWKNLDYCWSLISHLSLHYTSLVSVENLQNLLHTYNWTENVSNNNRINSIINIAITPITSIRRGAIMQGVEFKLTMREALFSSIADLHLFGLVLHHFFSMYVWLNFFVTTKIICDPSGKELVWQPITGKNYTI